MDLATTPLTPLNRRLGGKMVDFAGYHMPVHFSGIMGEHNHCREQAGLFDISHMGQVMLYGRSYEEVATAFERLVPMDVLGLADGCQRYGFFTNDAGGIEDDLMFARRDDALFVVVNAACKTADLELMRAGLPGIEVEHIKDRAMIALQGPAAESVLAGLAPEVAKMRFMDVANVTLNGAECWVSRSGYTGEDGFELSLPADGAEAIADALLDHAKVLPIGLGARDSLRLEAGLCLYGHDIDATTTPVAAGLTWAIQKKRRAGGDRAGGFPGAGHILADLETGSATKRVGLRPEGRAPMREGVQLFASKTATDPVGHITSGGFGPTVGSPVAMGYVATAHANTGDTLFGELRGKRLPLIVSALPFVAPRFKR